MSSQSKGKRLLIGTGIYAIGTFGTKILMFLIAPLYTYYLATSELGIYDVLISTINLLLPVISLQISDAIYRWFIRENVNHGIYLNITYKFLFASSIITAGIIIMLNNFISIPYIGGFLGALYAALFFQITQKILRGLQNQWLFVASGLVYTCVFLFLNVVQLCIFRRGVEGLLMSYILANLAGLLFIYFNEKRLHFCLLEKADYRLIKELLSFSVPLVPNYLSWWIIDSSDRYIVLYFLGVSFNGILAIAHKFPTILQSIFALFLNSWQDLSVSTDGNENDFYSTVFSKLYRFSFMLLWTLIPATKVFVIIIMGKEYKSSCNFIPFYYMGAVFQAFCSFYGVGYLKSKDTKGAFSSSVWAAIVNATVNILLIKIIGLQAAAVSTFIAFLIMWLIRVKQNIKILEIKINWKVFLALLISDVIICIISINSSICPNILVTVMGTICFLVFCFNDLQQIIIRIRKK